jgi:hypothetical protein
MRILDRILNRTPSGAAKERAGIRNLMRRSFSRVERPRYRLRSEYVVEGLGEDRAEVRLTAEQICDAGVIADSHTNLQGNVLLYDDIAEIDDIAEVGIAHIAEVKEPLLCVMPVMSVMPVMPVMPSTHGVEFGIDQFTHFTHDFDPRGVHVNNIWPKASQCLTRV